MQLHDIRPENKSKDKKRVGRGGKKGTYSGKGMKGQKSRAGRKLEPPIRGLIKRYHKLRGYKFNPLNKKNIVAVNLSVINDKFQEKETVSPKELVNKGIIRKSSGKVPVVKILGNGTIEKKLVFRNCLFSESASKKIDEVGKKNSSGSSEKTKEKIKTEK